MEELVYPMRARMHIVQNFLALLYLPLLKLIAITYGLTLAYFMSAILIHSNRNEAVHSRLNFACMNLLNNNGQTNTTTIAARAYRIARNQ